MLCCLIIPKDAIRGNQEWCMISTNENSLFRSGDWLSANQGPVFRGRGQELWCNVHDIEQRMGTTCLPLNIVELAENWIHCNLFSLRMYVRSSTVARDVDLTQVSMWPTQENEVNIKSPGFE
eukprot:sb/3476013/